MMQTAWEIQETLMGDTGNTHGLQETLMGYVHELSRRPRLEESTLGGTFAQVEA
jgi:hypothetical protein